MTDFNKLVWNRTIDKRGLTPTAVLVLDEMFDRANMDGTAIYGSQVNIAEKVGKSVESVRRAQRQLRDRGLIQLVKSGSSYGNQSSSFRLTYPEPDRSSEASSPVKSSPVIPDLTGHSRGADRSLVRGSPVTGEGLIDPLPDPGLNPGLGNTSPVTEADRSSQTEPPTGSAAAGPLPPDLTNQPTEGTTTMAANTYDPWGSAPEATTPPSGAQTPADVVKWPADKPLPKPGESGYRVGRVYHSYTGEYLGTAGEPEPADTPAASRRPVTDIYEGLDEFIPPSVVTSSYPLSPENDPWSPEYIPGTFPYLR